MHDYEEDTLRYDPADFTVIFVGNGWLNIESGRLQVHSWILLFVS